MPVGNGLQVEIKMFLSVRNLPRGLRLWAVLVSLTAGVLPVALVVSAQSSEGTLLERARAAEKTGDYQAAERAYLQALAIAPAP